MENQMQKKKPRILCFHGGESSGKIFEQQLKQWPEVVLERMDLVYIDGLIPVDESVLIGKFDPPYYTWYKNEDLNKTFNEVIAYIEDQMIRLRPFDGVLGVSQGGGVAGTLPGMQRQGVALTKVPKIKFVILVSAYAIGGSFLLCPELAKNAFSSPIDIPSLHIIGEKDTAKDRQLELAELFVQPTLLYHHGGHGVPQYIDDNGVKIILGFLNEIQRILVGEKGSSHGGGKCRMCCFQLELIASLFRLRRSNIRKSARVQSLMN